MAIARRRRGRRRATAPGNRRVARAGVAGMVPRPDAADMVPRAGVAGMVPVAAIAVATAAVNRAVRTPADADRYDLFRRVRIDSHLQSAVHDQYVDRPKRAVSERARNAAHDFEAMFLP